MEYLEKFLRGHSLIFRFFCSVNAIFHQHVKWLKHWELQNNFILSFQYIHVAYLSKPWGKLDQQNSCIFSKAVKETVSQKLQSLLVYIVFKCIVRYPKSTALQREAKSNSLHNTGRKSKMQNSWDFMSASHGQVSSC